MAEFPALPLWTDAFMADCGHLSDAEAGLYLRILMVMWRAPEQRIPNDDEWLGKRFGKDQNQTINLIRPLIREFCTCDGNWITQKRLSKEWEYVKNASLRHSAAAKSRWEKEREASKRIAAPHMPGNARPHGDASDLPPIETDAKNSGSDNALFSPNNGSSKRNAPTPTPTPTIKKEELRSSKESRGSRIPDNWQPSDIGKQFAINLGLDPAGVSQKFRDYWRAKSGQGATKKDWEATWRNWCRNECERQPAQRHTGFIPGAI